MMAKLEVTQVRSAIGAKPKQRGTLRALGLRRIGHSVEHDDTPVVRGMLAKVPHLVAVQDAPKPQKSEPAAKKQAARAKPARSEEEQS
jgi:large subunit ribosomal protein L30